MDNAFILSFAGLSFRIDAPSQSWKQALQKQFSAFLSQDTPQWRIALRHDPDAPDIHRSWAVHDDAQTLFRVAAYQGRVHLPSRSAEVSSPSLARAPSALARTVIFIATLMLPRELDGLLLHACGVAAGQVACAFCGPSGAGKSTIARLAGPELQVLSDENVIARLEGGDAALYSTPFWGQNTPESQVRRTRLRRSLAALFIPKQSPDWFLRPLRPSEAILALLATEKVAMERTESARAWLDVASRLIARVPIFELGFLPSPELWPFLTAQGFEFS